MSRRRCSRSASICSILRRVASFATLPVAVPGADVKLDIEEFNAEAVEEVDEVDRFVVDLRLEDIIVILPVNDEHLLDNCFPSKKNALPVKVFNQRGDEEMTIPKELFPTKKNVH